MRHSTTQAATAGLTYFAVVFTAGFILGAGRVLVLMPALGESFAVVVELPLILYLSWVASKRIAKKFKLPLDRISRGLMGGLAFGLLMAAELGISMFLFGRTLTEHLQHYSEASALLGLLGQIAFAAFPAIQARAEAAVRQANGANTPSDD